MKLFEIKTLSSKPFYLLLHPILMAFYVWVTILFFSPEYFKKYNAEIIRTELVNDYDKKFFQDLDGDGKSERIETGYNSGGEDEDIRVQHFNLERKVYDQWYIRGNWLKNYKPAFGDYNNNGYKEIYCLSIVDDSLFLHISELMKKDGTRINDRFVCGIGLFGDRQNDVVDVDGYFADLNNDGFFEYIFTVYSGFSKFPRNTFVYYITEDSLVMSPPSASGLNHQIQLMDINGDGIEEITGQVPSPENIHYEMPYTDSCSWLMVIDPKTLDFLFPPVKFDIGIGSWSSSTFFKIKNKKYIASVVQSNSAKKNVDFFALKVFNEKGTLINERKIKLSTEGPLLFISPQNGHIDKFYLIERDGKIFETDTSLKIKLFYNPDFEIGSVNLFHYDFLDIHGDGNNELFFLGKNANNTNTLFIFRPGLSEAVSITLNGSKSIFNWHINLMHNNNSFPPTIVLQADNDIYYIKYGKNNLYFLKYPAYVLVYLILFLIFWLLQKVQSQYAKRKFEEEKKLAKLQMAMSKRQLEPHFMLNTLNNIGFMFSRENKDDAQYYFGKFASLIHRGLKYADQVETSVEEELKFVRDYLILQKKRFNDNLEFLIESDEEIDLKAIVIPHSLIFTFVENAIKHGLQPKDSDRKLEIFVKRIHGKASIIISDNGIGRKQSEILRTSGTRKGLDIIDGIIVGYNKLNKCSISYKVEDLLDENGNEVGTQILVVT